MKLHDLKPAGAAALALTASMTTASAEELTLERLYASPSLVGDSPRSLAYSPDGKMLTFLKAREDDTSRLDLWAYDVESGEASMLVDSKTLEPDGFELSEEEKALRERKRIASSKGIVQYQWDSQGERILVPLAGDLFLVDVSDKSVRQLTDTEGFEYDAKVSPSGGYVSFLRDGTLYAIDLESGREQRLSPEGEGAVSYGTAEFVAQEEMSRYTGNWWSPDDARMVYTRTDESTVDVIPRFDIAAGDVTVIEQRYPRAGRPNAVVDLFIREPGKRRQVKVEWGASPDTYLARVNWAGPDNLYIQTVNRDQTELTISRVDLRSGDVEAVHTEEQPAWINLSKDFRGLDEGFLWTTEETGFRHIVRFDEAGEMTQITSGDWQVLGISAVDKEAGEVYFTANRGTPLERHLYKVSYLEPGEPERITAAGSTWSVQMAPDGKSFAGTSQNANTPPQTGLYAASGELITWVAQNALDEDHPYHAYLNAHSAPEFGTIEAEDGQTMHYRMIKPHDFDPNKQYPAILQVYGGPHVQRVTNSFTGAVPQYMQQQGYVVFQLDNRGTYNRGKKFEDVIHRRMSEVEVADQLQGVEFLASQDFVDADRIGVSGWSYGGYMALHLALRAPEGTFGAAVSGAPVTDWSLYDTFYTERYMDTPEENQEGYESASVSPYLDDLETPLLMIHGMADDNVTFDNSTRIFAILQEGNKEFEMMTYPGQRHGVGGKGISEHRLGTTMRFLNKHLTPGE
jgi:dipeptidyl-peptidase-4